MTRPALASAILLGLVLPGCPGPEFGFPTPISPFVPTADTSFLDPRLAAGETVTLEHTPPPISGGTLHVSGTNAIVSDPDRDRILVVDIGWGRILGSVDVPGGEPGRVAEDDAGHMHVVLRRSGEIFSFDPVDISAGTRRFVCAAPRGIAFDPDAGALQIACRDGELVTMPTAGDSPIAVAMLAPDLRDVVVSFGHLFVSTFRSAELLEVTREGTLAATSRPLAFEDPFNGSFDAATGAFVPGVFSPSVAWRTIAMSDGTVAMVHQRASDTELQTAPGAYYSTGACNGAIVQSAVTLFAGTWSAPSTFGLISAGPNLLEATLPVDVAASPDGTEITIIAAANESGSYSVHRMARTSIETDFGGGCGFGLETTSESVPNAIAAAYDGSNRLLVQSREPAALFLNGELLVALGGESAFDTGHAIYHGNAGRSTACASCHPEGGDDGRTWVFLGIGPRRTPSMFPGITSTAPFHWDGDLLTLDSLMSTVFTGRMGGPTLSRDETTALGRWLDTMPVRRAPEPRDVDAAVRGERLFYAEARCSDCHSGSAMTNSTTVDVGTGGAFQVPSLLGASHRLPLMHDGCANTLLERFDPACGGNRHGATRLDPTEIADLVAFLETI